jgi:signal transduction histidine kinase
VTKAQSETLGRIDRSQRHLLRLINDVLNLSRIEAGRVDYRIERVQLSELVNATIPMVAPQCAAKRIRLEQTVADIVHVSGDSEKIQQILLNLLTNAVKFTLPDGLIRVDAGLHEAGRVFLRVTDTGAGIPADMVDRIFEPFVQVDSSNTRSGEGTGLGLAISRDLARGMNGELSATSELGVGSVFTLTLPAA